MFKFILGIIFLTISFNSYSEQDSEIAEQARNILSEETAGFKTKKECITVKRFEKKCLETVLTFDVLLAVKKSKYSVDDVDNNETLNDFVILKVDGKTCESKTERFVTSCVTRKGKTNGVNTEFKVESPEGYKVYALKRVIKNYGYPKEVVYTPYSQELNTENVRDVGKDHLKELIEKAFLDLRNRGVLSLSEPNTLVADVVPELLIKHLAVIEHIDPERFRNEGIDKLAQEVYVIVGLNQNLAYRYAVSLAGASGLYQFMPRTYTYIVKIYPNANLDSDFKQGTANPENVVKAAILLADHDFSLLPNKVKEKVIKNINTVSEYIASSYNGGSKRAIAILKKRGDLVSNNSNPENRDYVKKLRAVMGVSW